MRLSSLLALIVLSSSSAFAAAPVCPDHQVDGILVQGAQLYTTSNNCDEIMPSVEGGWTNANFEVEKIKAISCGDDQFLLVKVYSPGYSPAEAIYTVRASDVILK